MFWCLTLICKNSQSLLFEILFYCAFLPFSLFSFLPFFLFLSMREFLTKSLNYLGWTCDPLSQSSRAEITCIHFCIGFINICSILSSFFNKFSRLIIIVLNSCSDNCNTPVTSNPGSDSLCSNLIIFN